MLFSVRAANSNEFKFPFYKYEKLVQIDKANCRLDIKRQEIIAQKHYEANNKLMAMQWLGTRPALKDTFNYYNALPGLSLQNNMRYRDMYVHEQISHERLDRELALIKKLGGDAGGNNYNRLQAKNSQIVVEKLSISRSYLFEIENTLLRVLGLQTMSKNKNSKEDEDMSKGDYNKDFKPGLYEATYRTSEYETKHNKSCMWMYDRLIKKSDPYCGYVWSHGENFYLERCPGDVHPFGKGHASSAGVSKVADLFSFKSVKECKKQPQCSNGCFNTCIKKNQFNIKKTEELKDGKCLFLVDPLFPAGTKGRSLTKKYLKDFKTFPSWYPKFSYNNRSEKDVAVEIERYYLMTGEYEEADCKKGKRAFLLEVLDAVKQLISLEKNLKEYYQTSASCNIKLAKDFEELTMEGVKLNPVEKDKSKKAALGSSAIVKKGKNDKEVFSDAEAKEMQASFFGLTYADEQRLLKDLIKNNYKFSNDDIGLICKRSEKKEFCGGK